MGSLWPGRTVGRPHIAKVVVKFVVFMFLFQNKKYFCFVKDIHEYAARRRLLGRSPDAPQTLQDTPWRCFWGSHLLRRPLGMHHIVKVLMKFAVFRFLFQKNDLVVVFLGAGSLLKTKRS